MNTRTRTQRTVFDELLFIVDDTDVLPGQVANLAVLDFPQFIGDLRNQTYGGSSSVKNSCNE